MNTKILIVDDDYIDLETLKRYLRNEKYEVLTVSSGLEALDKVNSDPSINIALIDAIMPKLNGFDTCRKIKEINKDIAIVLVTGLTDEESLKRAFESGAMDFISKPVKKQEVLSRIKNILKIKSSEIKINKLYNDLILDLELASSVQSYLVPSWINNSGQVFMSSSYIPYSSVSGDLYDFITLSENKHLIYVGDISGHGVQASLIMAAIQTAIKLEVTEHRESLNIVHVLNSLNSIFSNTFSNMDKYMTFMLGILDMNNKTFTYFSAGHPPPILIDKTISKTIINKEKGSFPIGMFPNIEYTEDEIDIIHFNENILIMLYTDGLFECISKDNTQSTFDNLISTIESIKLIDPVSYPEEIINNFIHKKYKFDDDVTLSLIFFKSVKEEYSSIVSPSLNSLEQEKINIDKFLSINMVTDNFSMNLKNVIFEYLKELIRLTDENQHINKEKIFISVQLTETTGIVKIFDKTDNRNFLENKTNKDIEKVMKKLTKSISYRRINDMNEASFILNL